MSATVLTSSDQRPRCSGYEERQRRRRDALACQITLDGSPITHRRCDEKPPVIRDGRTYHFRDDVLAVRAVPGDPRCATLWLGDSLKRAFVAEWALSQVVVVGSDVYLSGDE